MNHTPAPWKQGELLDTYSTLKWSDDDRDRASKRESLMVFSNFTPEDQGRSRKLIASCSIELHDIKEAEANARLITAAPDLLQALELLSTNPHLDLGDLVYHIRESEGKGWDGESVTKWNEAIAKMKYALAKAKGDLTKTV